MPTSGTPQRVFPPKRWYRSWAERLDGAACRDEQWAKLPWTVEDRPREHELLMRDVCLGCRVRFDCAEYALDRNAPAQGGFYAGMWIPWKHRKPERSGFDWLSARTVLRRLAKDLKQRQENPTEQEKRYA